MLWGMHRLTIAIALTLTLVSPALIAQQPAPSPSPAPAAAPDLPPLPADAHVAQSMQLGGRALNYTATIGTLPVFGADGKKTGAVVFPSYTVDGPNRPVTFALNGGPGASSVYLNFGAIGPKHVAFGEEGDSPSDPPTLTDNPGTWLDFTDLVFIDPVGTGFSRSLVAADQTKRDFYSTENDIQYLSRVVFDWLTKNKRLQSRKYLAGESYGGYRVPRMTHFLQSQLGVAMNGIVAVSPYLNPTIDADGDLSPMAWITLPSTGGESGAPAQAVRDTMAPVSRTREARRRGSPERAVRSAGASRLVDRVSESHGPRQTFVRAPAARSAHLREVHRSEGKIGSVYDSNVTSFDLICSRPASAATRWRASSPTTTAMVDFVTRVVG